MLTITGPTLELVRRIVAAEGPGAQMTELTDGILSQVLDVSRMIPGLGTELGWVWLRNSVTHSATTIQFGSISRADVLAQLAPVPPESVGVWLMAAALNFFPGAATDDLEQATIAVDFPAMGFPLGGGGGFVATVARAGATEGDWPRLYNLGPVYAGSSHEIPVPPPIIFPMGAVVRHASRMNVQGAAPESSTRADLLFWVGPLGLNPPGVA